MTKETKDSIAVISACVMLIFGIILTAIGFALDPAGEVSDSVLWIWRSQRESVRMQSGNPVEEETTRPPILLTEGMIHIGRPMTTSGLQQ